ncbi:hypothetical protein KJ855_03475 [Patescibacteria group bacterium]|nr:hypothetical protein [Patescibacteria group bacterium]
MKKWIFCLAIVLVLFNCVLIDNVEAYEQLVFGGSTEFAVGTKPRDVLTVDLDEDGHMDVISLNNDSDNI